MPVTCRLRPLSITLVVIGALTGAGIAGSQLKNLLTFAQAGTAYSAKVLCSGVLMSGLEPERLEREDLALGSALIRARVDRERNQVRATALAGLISAVAVRQANLGCSLDGRGQPLVRLPAYRRIPAQNEPTISAEPWPLSPDAAPQPPELNQAALEDALDQAFSEPDPDNRPRRSRAVVVVQDGWVVAERYADGITPTTPLVGWSMTKSVVHALIGLAIGDGLLDLDRPAPIPEWSRIGNDPRAAITWRQLLAMNSGLAFDELSRDLKSDLVLMLTQTDDMGAFAAAQPLTAVPGQRWAYASGTTAILSNGLRHAINDDDRYWRYPYERLFHPIGMSTAVLETDASGHFVGSSFGWASARDWARFGMLYLNEGRWNGVQLLPEGWTQQARRISRGSGRNYGSHWWINRGRRHPNLPRSSYSAEGYQGQLLLVAPSHNAVIVRLGQTPEPGDFDRNRFAAAVLAALKS
ncbi:MAG: serine hydrolase domain-containing protein [Synechococcus sp.]